ncbi:MAG: hypothetical protein Q8O89_05585 [Nanoarchaeota archaeon]|nr:hypothetical protein [Nanoarchaeota archaeon]
MARKKSDESAFLIVFLLVLAYVFYKKYIEPNLKEIIHAVIFALIFIASACLLILLLYLLWKKIDARKAEETTSYEITPKIVMQEPTRDEPKEIEIKQEIPKPKIVPETPKIHHEIKEKPKEIMQKRVVVRTELEDINFHKASKLNDDEIDFLKRRDFKIKNYFNPFKRKKEGFVFKKNPIESDSHFLTIYLIADFLKGKVDNLKTFQTKKPDITFKFKNKKYAIEVETGKIHSKSKKQLQEKVDLLNQNYDKWFFVVIKRNFVSRYRKFGKVIDARYLKNQLNKLVSK